jgi:hypothetical protein
MAAKKKLKKQSMGPYQSQKVANAQLRFFEVLHIIKDRNGEIIFTGSKAMHDRVLKALNRFNKSNRKRKSKPRRRK